MYCPQLPDEQSLVIGEKRLEKAALSLGSDVLQRLLIFVLYILGFNRDVIARLFGYQVSGIKTLVDRVFDSGMEGLYDHRRTKGAGEQKDAVTVTDAEDHKQVDISGTVINVPKYDLLARKIISVMLVESELLSNIEGAAILDYTSQAFGRLRERYRLKGSAGLIDQRKGQQGDFKVTPEIKAALVYDICKKARDGIAFSSKDLCDALNEQFPGSKISQRTIRHHLTQLGLLPHLRKGLVKKTEHTYYPAKPVRIEDIVSAASSQKKSFNLVRRAGMILQLVTGNSVEKAADYWHLSTRTVRKWADRFYGHGLKGLLDLPRSGRPQVYQPSDRLQVVGLACQYPGKQYLPGVTHWSVRGLSGVISAHFQEIGQISRETIRRILKAHRLKPHRSKYFLTRTDPNFFVKAKQVIELYLSPPQDGLVICVDERTGIQVLERKYPGLPMIPGHCERQEFEYIRHGTFCLIAGLNIVSGQVFGQCYERHTNVEFRDFLEKLSAAYPARKLYIILDNLKTHLHHHVQQLLMELDIQFVFLPFHGSWLNQIEIWFGVLNQHCIKRSDFKDKEAGMNAVMQFISTWDSSWAHPFNWKFNVDDLEKLMGIEQITLPEHPSSVA